MKKFLLLTLAIGLSITIKAQSVTEGKLISKQRISTDNEMAKAQFEQMGDMITTTYFKGDKSRTELSNPMAGDVITIIDSKNLLMLMDNPALGKKYTLQNLDEVKNQVKSVEVKEGTETKTILGYKCKQYKVVMKQETSAVEMILYTSEEIKINHQQSPIFGDKVKGYPLYIVTKANQMGINIEVTAEVTEIKEEKVSDSKFNTTPPEGYDKM